MGLHDPSRRQADGPLSFRIDDSDEEPPPSPTLLRQALFSIYRSALTLKSGAVARVLIQEQNSPVAPEIAHLIGDRLSAERQPPCSRRQTQVTALSDWVGQTISSGPIYKKANQEWAGVGIPGKLWDSDRPNLCIFPPLPTLASLSSPIWPTFCLAGSTVATVWLIVAEL